MNNYCQAKSVLVFCEWSGFPAAFGGNFHSGKTGFACNNAEPAACKRAGSREYARTAGKRTRGERAGVKRASTCRR